LSDITGGCGLKFIDFSEFALALSPKTYFNNKIKIMVEGCIFEPDQDYVKAKILYTQARSKMEARSNPF
jgi:hypothetical protein